MKQNIENINKRGIDLRDLGIDAYAYDYSVIPDLLDNLKANNQIILGGDFFATRMANWHILMKIRITRNKIQLLIAGNPFSKQKSISATM